MNSRRSPSGAALPSYIGQIPAQTLAAGNPAQVVLEGIPGINPGDPMIVTTPHGGTAGNLPLSARSTEPGKIAVTLWNVSGIGQVIDPPGLVFKVVVL